MGRLFGTDGVRGLAGRDLTCELAMGLGRAGAAVVAGEAAHRPLILVGRDTRLSGGMLESALVAGMLSAGADVVRLGVVTTPAVAYLTVAMGADAGAMITASHNPYEDNGIKFFSREGFKLPDAQEDAIEAMLGANGFAGKQHDGIGAACDDASVIKRYTDHLMGTTGERFGGMTLALDCANGSASFIAPELFRAMGARVHIMGAEPDGRNINRDCGSTHTEGLQAFTVQVGADAGLAFDGDADRLIMVDHEGALVEGDEMMLALAMGLKAEGKLEGDTLVATVMSNLGLELAARREGIALERTVVGDRYVLERMLEKGFVLGGEQSGHIIFKHHATTGDGMLTAIQMLAVMKRTGKSLKALAGCMERLPQVLIGVKVAPEKLVVWGECAAVREVIADAEARMDGRGRVLVRASGTEPLLRIMLEGEDDALIRELAEGIARVVRERL